MRILIFFLLAGFALPASTSICKDVGGSWTKLSYHVVSSINYAIAFPAGSRVEVGTGFYAFGEPRGSRYKLEQPETVSAYGIGSIHIRSLSGEKIRVCVDTSGASAITLFSREF